MKTLARKGLADGADFRLVLGLAALLAVLLLKGFLAAPPSLRTETPAGAFDTARAIDRLARILGDERPHPVDTDANDAVRARLLAEIEALGYAPEVRDDFACRGGPWRVACARVRNVLFVAGPQPGEGAAKAVMIASHYDSVPAGPGAADDGAGVAASLEIAALIKGEALSRPVLFLITDGEEMGLLGARSFAETDPYAEHVGRVINLEARGVKGPVLMFETADPNGADARLFAAGAARPFSNSMMTNIYKLLPNDTDVSEFLPLGYGATNLALNDGAELYHTPGDNLAALDRRSVQHMGDLALGTLRAALGGEPKGGDRLVFADILGRVLVLFPQAVALAILVVGAAVALAAFWRAGGERPLRAILAPPLMIAAGAGLVYGLQALVGLLRPEALYWVARPEALTLLAYAGAMLGVVLMLTIVGRGAGAARLSASSWFWFAALGLGAFAVAPGAAVYFAPPLALFSLGAALGFLAPAARRIGAFAGLLLLVVMLTPTLHLVEIGLGLEVAAVPAVLVAVLATIAATALLDGPARLSIGPIWAAGVATLAAFGWTLLVPAYSPANPRPLNLVYFLDADARAARWVIGSTEEPLPPAMARLAEFAPTVVEGLGSAARPAATAPFLEQAAPELLIVGDSAEGAARRVRFVLSPHGAHQVILRIPAEAGAGSARIDGRDIAFAGEEDAVLSCIGRSCDGAAFEVLLSASAPTRWLILGYHYALPGDAAPLIAARPEWASPVQNGDVTIIRTMKDI